MKNNVLVVSGGSVNIELLKEIFDNYKTVVAVDKGLESIYKLNKNPDCIVGDFDSVDNKILDFYKEQKVKIYEYDAEKDYTDTELGIDTAMSFKPDEITIIGAIGTRIDHTLANIHILKKCLEKGVKCEIIDEHNKIYLINSVAEIKNPYGKFFSIIPLTSEVKGITLKGFKYPLENYTLEIGKSLGISNEIVEEVATVQIKSGILIIIESKD